MERLAERISLDDTVLPAVDSVTLSETRRVAVHHPLGAEGAAVQDLGRAAMVVEISGWIAADDETAMTQLKALAARREPMILAAGALAGSTATRFVVDDLRVEASASASSDLGYRLRLRSDTEERWPAGGTLGSGFAPFGDALDRAGAGIPSVPELDELPGPGSLSKLVEAIESVAPALEVFDLLSRWHGVLKRASKSFGP